MKKRILTISSLETKKIAKYFAENILKPQKKSAFIIGLIGNLGGGKTTFIQGFAKGLGIKEKILSPTFVILKRFKIPRSNPFGMLRGKKDLRFKYFYHIDCYRIEKSKELLDLDFKEIIANPQNIVAIEWADKIKNLLPKNAILLKFRFKDKNKREILINQQVG